MKLNKSLIVLLAVFMLILSAGAVSAEGFLVTDDGDESVATDFEDVAGDGDDVKTSDDVATDDNTDDEGDDVATGDDAPEVVAAPDDAAGNATGDDATGSSSNLSKNPTANPILVLLAAIASVGIASIKRK